MKISYSQNIGQVDNNLYFRFNNLLIIGIIKVRISLHIPTDIKHAADDCDNILEKI